MPTWHSGDMKITIVMEPEITGPSATLTVERDGRPAVTMDVTLGTHLSQGVPAIAVDAAQQALLTMVRESLAAKAPSDAPPAGHRWVLTYELTVGPTLRPGWKWRAIEEGVADLVEQLQRCAPGSGHPLLPTSAACEGHAGEPATVTLLDGRTLSVSC